MYRTAFPERSHPEVTSDIQSLAAYGFPETLLQTWATVIPSFNALQLAAINEFKVLEGEHLVVSAPTSSGKTTIGELATLKSVLMERKAIAFSQIELELLRDRILLDLKLGKQAPGYKAVQKALNHFIAELTYPNTSVF